MHRGVDVVGIGCQVGQVSVVDAHLGIDFASRYDRVSATTTLPKPEVGVPSMTRGLPTVSVVCQDTTISVLAFRPNCRCRPPTGGAPLRPR